MKTFLRCFLVLLTLPTFRPLLAGQTKLVVIVVLDQFPSEYLNRFGPYFSPRGFNALRDQGAEFTNARYEHAYTKTAPGHAAISTGAYAHLNGITTNRWYDRTTKKGVSAVDDETVQLVGRRGTGRSPRNLLTYTLGDMLRIHSAFRSKVLSVSAKDRSAILLGGKLGTAFWIADSTFVTSTYYMKELPAYISSLNSAGLFRQYFGRRWLERNPTAASRICDIDNAPYEADPSGLGRAFPHPVTGDNRDSLTSSFFDALEHTPYSTEILFRLAQSVCIAESLGTRAATDMLCIGISTTDIVGHAYGPMSHEVFDNAVVTDSLLGAFLSFLNTRVGLAHCLIAVTSDHGIAPIPEFLTTRQPSARAGRVTSSFIRAAANGILDRAFGNGQKGVPWVEAVIETDITLDREVLRQHGVALASAERALKDSLPRMEPIAAAFTEAELQGAGTGERFEENVRKSFYPDRSGDVLLVLKPYFIMSGDSTGTNHGQPYDYDAHVPLIIRGEGVRPGKYREEVSPVDLAPTIAAILGVEFPPSREGRVLREALK